MNPCVECEDEIPEARSKMGYDICTACQEDMEKAGLFIKAKIEVFQELKGWSLEGLDQVIIPGGKR